MTSSDDFEPTLAPRTSEEPIEGVIIPPVDRPAPAAEPQDGPVDVDDFDDDEPGGIPAAHLAAGGLSASATAVASLYQLLGLPGLIGGGVLAGGSAVAYVRHRYQRRQRSMAGVSWEAGRGGHGGRRSTASDSGGSVFGALRSQGRSSRSGGLLGGRAGGTRSGASGAFGGLGGRSRRSSSTGSGGLFNEGRSRSTRGRDSKSSKGSGSGADRRSTTSGGASTKAGRSAQSRTAGPVAAARNFAASRVRQSRERSARRPAWKDTRGAQLVESARQRAGAARNFAASRIRQVRERSRTQRATAWKDSRGAQMVESARRVLGPRARRLGAWADRRTGARVSTAWQAARGEGGFTAARRRAASALGTWDAQLTASLVALVALVVEQVRRYRARKSAAQDIRTSEQDTSNDTKENTKQDDDQPVSVVHDGTGVEPPIRATVTCPRCGVAHEVVVPGGQAKTVITCGCGYTINFFRIPATASSETAQSTPSAQTTTANQAGTVTATRIYRRNRSMSANPLAAAAAEVNAVAAAHSPEDMWTVARELDQLHEVPANIAMAVRTYTMRLQGEYPVDPAVVDAIHELYQGLAQLVPVAEEIAVMFRTAHAEDLKREEAPRTNEQLWDVGRI
ncbi:hypothetical protein [Streptosporangium longisporum]|uniref:Uncharacterized protein n=1 Tax=Streptosporangium longisporum TaxID=46187 RepID=A0ABP6LER2_9ACTN